MTNEKIDLQLIAQNLLNDNTKIREYLENEDNREKALNITANKLSAKYPTLKSLSDTVLIAFYPTNKGISISIPHIAKFDGEMALFGTDNKIWDKDYQLNEYKLDLTLSSASILITDIELIIGVKISQTAIAKIKKDDDGFGCLIGTDAIKLDYLEEKTIFVPIKELDLGQYKLVKNTKKRTKYKDLIIHIESINTGEIIKYVAINSEVDKLISKYGKDTKFEIIRHENFVNDDGKKAIKTIIKDLNFKEDLSDLDLF
jgi:hypothetical protein